MKIRIIPEAELDILSARDYLDTHADGLGDRFVADVRQTIAAIAARPLQFPKLETVHADPEFRRAMTHIFQYVVVFRIARDQITVLAVTHTSRAPDHWFERGD